MAKQANKTAATGEKAKKPASGASKSGKSRATKPAIAPQTAVAPERLRVLAWVAGVVLLLDQLSKYYVVHVLRLDRLRQIELLPPWLNLHMAWNQGVNFGLFSSTEDMMRWVLIAIALAVCIWVFIWVRRTRPGWFSQLAAGLLIGGALGNVIDRIAYGAVADFLNMSLPNWQNPYSFNVADISIFAGAFGLILQPPQRKSADEDKTRDAPGKSG